MKTLTAWAVALGLTVLPAHADLVIVTGLIERTAYNVWKDGIYVGTKPTWYNYGVLSFDLAAPGTWTVILYSDSVVTDVKTPPFKAVRVYPSPTSSNLTVETTVSGALELYDVAGRRVGTRKVSRGTTTFLLDLPSGVYFWRLQHWRGSVVLVR